MTKPPRDRRPPHGSEPWGLASDGANLYVADSENYAIRSGNNEIRSVTVPGASVNTGRSTPAGHARRVVSAMLLYGPQGIYVTPTNMVVITETGTSSSEDTVVDGLDHRGNRARDTNGVGARRSTFRASSDRRFVDLDRRRVQPRSVRSTPSRTVGPSRVSCRRRRDRRNRGQRLDRAFSYPSGITQVGSFVFICDNVANTIRKLDLVTMQVTTFAGTKWSAGFTDAIGALASFNSPTSITNDGTFLYVTDYYNHTDPEDRDRDGRRRHHRGAARGDGGRR